MKKIVRNFYPNKFRNYWERNRVIDRFVEIIKSMPKPVFRRVSNSTEDYIEAQNKNGIVIYRLYTNHFECLEIENKLRKELKND